MPRFITFEGGEGVGKTTQIQRLKEYLVSLGNKVLITREPGGTEIGEAIRQVLLDKTLPGMHQDTELLLMFAARAEHVQTVIYPVLADGVWVLSDRFVDASHVYQGVGRGVDATRIDQLERWTLGGFQPDLTFLLDMPVAAGMKRVHTRGETDRFETENLDFFQRIREGYLSRVKKFPERYRIIDAEQDLDVVTASINGALDKWLE
ncbi:MAG: dTMP kinase [Thiothrix sp.]|nr:MAG: dTMP kinase [Thiothrix sp.]